jgi:hypothetical protein
LAGGDLLHTLDDYFGIDGNTLGALDRLSPESPTHLAAAGEHPSGQRGTVSAFTDWRRSPVFWVAVFAVFALGYIHLEGHVRVALK